VVQGALGIERSIEDLPKKICPIWGVSW